MKRIAMERCVKSRDTAENDDHHLRISHVTTVEERTNDLSIEQICFFSSMRTKQALIGDHYERLIASFTIDEETHTRLLFQCRNLCR